MRAHRVIRRTAAALLALPAALLLAVPGASAASSHSVSIVDAPTGGCTSTHCFQPADVSAKGGDSVTWTNNSTVPHTVSRCDPTACNGVGPGSGGDADFNSSSNGIDSGQTYSHTFNAGGTYNYYCMFHGYSTMHGTITVSGSSATPTAVVTQTPAHTATPTPAPTPTPTPARTPTPPPTATPTPAPTPSATAAPTTSSSSSSEVALAPTTDTTSSTSGIGAIAPTNVSSSSGHTGLVVGLIAAALILGGLGTLVALNRDRIPFLRPR